MKLVKVLLFLLPFLFLFFLLWQKDFAFNEDLGRHLILGKRIIQCHCLPSSNAFSYTYSSFPWFTNSWGSAVVFYELYTHVSKDALLYLKIFLITISFAIVYIHAWRNYSRFWTVLVSFPALTIFYFRFSLRPELFSFLFLALFLLFIALYRKTLQEKFLWVLIPLELLWVNMHIYFIFGIALYGCLLSEILFAKQLVKRKETLLIFFLLIITTCINPVTYGLALLPFTIFLHYGGTIVENQSIFSYLQTFSLIPSPFTISFTLFEVLSIVLIISCAMRIGKKQQLSLYFMAISLLGIYFAGRMIRFLPLFALLSFFPLIANLTALEKRIAQFLAPHVIQTGKGYLTVFSLILFSTVIYTIAQSPNFGLAFQENYKQSVDFIENNTISGPMFNGYNNGAYITFRLYPKQKVFIDARAEAYPETFVGQFENMLANPHIFDMFDKQYHFNYIIMTSEPGITAPVVSYLLTKQEWVPVYVDTVGNIIFLRNTQQNKQLIQQYQIHKQINVIN